MFSTDAGVYFYDSISSKIKNIITENKGLINNQCKKTITYNNSLWVATNSGLSKILFSENCEINTIVNFNISDGLISNFINDILIKNDTIYVATNEGLSVFPCNLKKNSYKPLINIIEAKTNLKPHNIYEPIKLTPKGNNISITYSNMLFSKSNESSYEFRLLPSTKKWTETNETSIAFSNLNPNSYTFEVRSAGINKIARVTFEVMPRFTQTLLFKFIIFLLLSSLTVLFFNRRMKLVRRKNFIEKTISQLELEAIKAQINPHFIYNSLNSIKNTIIKKENLIAEQQLSVFAKLVRQTLSISQKNFITLDKEIDYLNNYLEMEKMRFKENLTYSINLKNIDSSSEFVLPSMLLQPFIENSIKHGMPSDESLTAVITINFILKENILYCELKDNGPGVSNTSSDTNHISQGIKMSSKRASTYNKLYNTNITVEIENKIENGTLINISIPQKNIQ